MAIVALGFDILVDVLNRCVVMRCDVLCYYDDDGEVEACMVG